MGDVEPSAVRIHRDRLEITVSGGPDPVIVVVGELDAYTGPALSEALASGGDATLDLSGVTFVDSSALRILVLAHQERDQRGARLRLQTPSDAVRRLLDVSGLSGVFLAAEG